MKTLTSAMALLFLAVGIGCEKTTAESAGGKRLTLFHPASQVLKQGEISEIQVQVRRENFDGEVRVAFDNLPSGVSVLGLGPIPRDKDRADYTLHAAPDAGIVANHQARVVVQGPDGVTATAEFGISVEARRLAGK